MDPVFGAVTSAGPVVLSAPSSYSEGTNPPAVTTTPKDPPCRSTPFSARDWSARKTTVR